MRILLQDVLQAYKEPLTYSKTSTSLHLPTPHASSICVQDNYVSFVNKTFSNQELRLLSYWLNNILFYPNCSTSMVYTEVWNVGDCAWMYSSNRSRKQDFELFTNNSKPCFLPVLPLHNQAHSLIFGAEFVLLKLMQSCPSVDALRHGDIYLKINKSRILALFPFWKTKKYPSIWS